MDRAEPHIKRHEGVIYTTHRRQTMDERITTAGDTLTMAA
jgi:hypothetical protein